MTKVIKTLIIFILFSLSIYILILVWPSITNIIKYIFRILLPFIIAFILAYVLNPLVNALTKYLHRRGYAVIITIFLLFLVIYLSFSFLIPFFVKEAKGFMDNYDTIIKSLEDRINEFASKFDFLPIDYRPSFANLKDLLQGYIDKMQLKPETVLEKLIDYVSVIVVIPMSLIYFLIDFEKIKLKIKEYFEERGKTHFVEYLRELNKSIYTFVKTTLIIMFIMMMLSTISFWIVGLDYPLVFGIIIAVTNVIPYLGPYIGGAFPVGYALIKSTSTALVVLIIVIIIQIIESDIISPYLHGKRNDINPLLVIFGLVLFGKLFGVVGMILSIPLMTIIKITNTYYPLSNVKNLFNKLT